MTNAVDGIITQVRKEDIDKNGDYIGPMSTKEANGEKRPPARQKPRWGRFVQSLCCCVAPQAEIEKAAVPRNPSLLITQVQKNGGATNGTTLSDTTTDDFLTVTAGISPTILPEPTTGEKFLLPPVRPSDMNKKCLIIDLDETLVHSSFKPVKNPDFVIPVEIDGIVHQVYVLKRPYVDEFLARIGDRYECVLFTASLAKYADPVADLLDKRGVFRSRLFREACVYHKGNYVKDLARLGRDLSKVLIIDNSPASYAFHPENAIPVPTWWDDPSDVELLDILPLLERLEKAESIYEVLKHDDPVSEPLLEQPSPKPGWCLRAPLPVLAERSPCPLPLRTASEGGTMASTTVDEKVDASVLDADNPNLNESLDELLLDSDDEDLYDVDVDGMAPGFVPDIEESDSDR
ncbi:hypothetical protein RB195_006511 [Necator americanus]|uniref:protein-serine/threonine phosphatase n=1 Tax=Necator americanus TaxID=51031 RepID=A0ABR1BUG0_NECAM